MNISTFKTIKSFHLTKFAGKSINTITRLSSARNARYLSTFPSQTTIDFEKDLNNVAARIYDPVPVVFHKAKGCVVTDIDGKEYLDFLASYSAVNQGHCHPRLQKAMRDQLELCTLSSRAFLNDRLLEFSQVLTSTFKYDRVIPMNTGVEGGETAIKLARRWGYRSKGIEKDKAVVLFGKNNFWGRTLAALSSSTDKAAYEDFGPYMPGFDFINFNDIKDLETKLKENKNICGVMLEAIQGEGGVVVPDDGYLAKVRELCTFHNVLFIADEVQTGMGRTGKLNATDYEDARPDILILGKALSGGMYPVSAVLADLPVTKHLTTGSHGSTFGGNSLACAVGIEAVKVLLDEGMVENSFAMGQIFRDELQDLLALDGVRAVRGKGLMNAIEFEPATEKRGAWQLTLKLAEQGILAKPTKSNIIRFTPPLVINKEQLDKGLNLIKKCVKQMYG